MVVDDGSQDSTPQIIREYATRHPNVRLLQNPGNKGKGYSVRNGMLAGKGDILILSDADLSAPIYEAKKLFAAIEQSGAQMAIGSRWKDPGTQTQRQPVYRQITGRIFNFLLRSILGLRVKDSQCGFKAFTREAAQNIFPNQKIERWGFDAELLFLGMKLHYKIEEIPVEWKNDLRSKVRPIRDGFSIVWDMVRIRWYSISGQYRHVTTRPVVTPVNL